MTSVSTSCLYNTLNECQKQQLSVSKRLKKCIVVQGKQKTGVEPLANVITKAVTEAELEFNLN